MKYRIITPPSLIFQGHELKEYRLLSYWRWLRVFGFFFKKRIPIHATLYEIKATFKQNWGSCHEICRSQKWYEIKNWKEHGLNYRCPCLRMVGRIRHFVGSNQCFYIILTVLWYWTARKTGGKKTKIILLSVLGEKDHLGTITVSKVTWPKYGFKNSHNPSSEIWTRFWELSSKHSQDDCWKFHWKIMVTTKRAVVIKNEFAELARCW